MVVLVAGWCVHTVGVLSLELLLICVRLLVVQLSFASLSIDVLACLLAQVMSTLGTRPLFASQYPEQRVVRLEEGRSYLLQAAEDNKADENSAVILGFQVRSVSVFVGGF